MTNPLTLRFQIGKTYRLHTSPDFARLRGGTITVLAEIKPADRWSNRILLVDARLDPSEDGGGGKEILGTRCFVEEGFATRVDSYGWHTIPVEIATVQGVYPDFAKAYANAEVGVMPKKTPSPNPNRSVA